MLHQSSPSSRARHRFLENAQERLLENLDQKPVAHALGAAAVQRIKGASSLLIIPNVRNGRAIMPREYRDSDSIPYVAIKRGENLGFERPDLFPTPSQRVALWGLIQTWTASQGGNVSDIEKHMKSKMERKMPAINNFSLAKKQSGRVENSLIGFSREDLGMSYAPEVFYWKGRPIVELAYAAGYRTDIVLAHELIHLDQDLSSPILGADSNGAPINNGTQDELEAYHYEAKYISAIPVSRIASLLLDMDGSKLASTRIESIREKYADPERPFEPNEALVEALRAAHQTFVD